MRSRQTDTKSVKVQITLPANIVTMIEEEVKDTYSSKSFWFLKLLTEYFEQKEKDKSKKKIISLDIK